MGAGVTHNGPNGALKRGLEALGDVHCADIPRNCNDDVCSGFCCFGCASGDKQVSTASLPLRFTGTLLAA